MNKGFTPWNKKHKLDCSTGFTLIETLIYIAIIGVVLASIVSFSLSISDSNSKNYVVQEVQANTRIATNMITQRIFSANGINIGASTFDSDPGVLSLAMADSTKNPTIISLNADNGQLQITEGLASAVLAVSNEVKITNLVFTNLTGSSNKENIRIQMTVEYNNSGNDQSYNYSQTIQTSASLRQ